MIEITMRSPEISLDNATYDEITDLVRLLMGIDAGIDAFMSMISDSYQLKSAIATEIQTGRMLDWETIMGDVAFNIREDASVRQTKTAAR